MEREPKPTDLKVVVKCQDCDFESTTLVVNHNLESIEMAMDFASRRAKAHEENTFHKVVVNMTNDIISNEPRAL